MAFYLYEVSSIYTDSGGNNFGFWVLVDCKIPSRPNYLWSKPQDRTDWIKWGRRPEEIDAWCNLIKDNRSITVLKRKLTKDELVMELL